MTGIKDSASPLTELQLEEILPRSSEARENTLTNILVDKIAKFISSKTVQITLPKVTSNELSREIEEGRGKMKKMMSKYEP